MNAARAAVAGATRRASVVLAAIALCAAVFPARVAAVDRSLGAGVAKPAQAGASWSARAIRRLGRDLDALLANAPTLRGAHVGLLVIDTRDGRALYARDADDAFMPASTFKLLTGSVALATLGPAFRFHTEADLSAGGTLVLRGGGDPLLRAAHLDELASALRAAGTTSVADVAVDATALEPAPYPPGWAWDDLVYDYGAPISAATIEENTVHLVVTPGAAAGARASVRAAAPFERIAALTNGCSAGDLPVDAIRVSDEATTSAASGVAGGDTLDISRGAGGCIIVRGGLPLGSAPETLDAAVPDPTASMHRLVLQSLAAAGIVVRAAAAPNAPHASPSSSAPFSRATGRVVWRHDGEVLSDLLADIWWPSDNLAAELLLRTIGRGRAGGPGTMQAGADAERAWLGSIGIDPATVTIADGSGLSGYDRITPRALAAILQADWNGPNRDSVLDDLPLAGVRGTLSDRFAGTLAERRTFAKTGSVNHTRGLAGFLATLRHGAVTFAWSIDDWMGTQADLDAVRGAVLSRIIGD